MYLELIATFVIGFGAAGAVLLLNKVLGGLLPKWVMPATAGLAMIGFAIWSEYSWFSRTANSLPDEVVIAWINEDKAVYRPWTYVVPQKNRFVAVDVETIKTNPALPGQRMVDLYILGRWAPGRHIRVVIDCVNNRRADLLEDIQLDANGAPEDAAWVALDADDGVLNTTCDADLG